MKFIYIYKRNERLQNFKLKMTPYDFDSRNRKDEKYIFQEDLIELYFTDIYNQ